MEPTNQPTQRTHDLFIELGKQYFYCNSLSCWLTEDKCKDRHRIALRSIRYQNVEGAVDDITIACMVCGKHERVERKKRCNVCGEVFDATTDNFYIEMRGKFGLRGLCKVCDKKGAAVYREKQRRLKQCRI